MSTHFENKKIRVRCYRPYLRTLKNSENFYYELLYFPCLYFEYHYKF